MKMVYQKRTKRELRRAMKWAQRLLGVDDVALELWVDKVPWGLRALCNQKGDLTVCGAYYGTPGSQTAQIAVLRVRCRETDVDPVQTLCHEMVHVTGILCDTQADRYANVLYALWEHECGSSG